MNFDWFTLGFCIIIALSMLIGFFKGGLKTIIKLAIVGVSILIAIFVRDKVAPMFRNGETGNYFYNLVYETIEKSSPDAAKNYSAPIVASGLADKSIIQAMADAGIPESIQQNLLQLIKDTASQVGTLTINPASVIASTASDYICIGLGYIVLFVGSSIVLFLIYFVVCILLKVSGKKPSTFSRILGIIVGLVEGISVCWCICLAANFALASENSISEVIKQMIKFDDPNYWSLAKWMITTDFGYSSILNLFLK